MMDELIWLLGTALTIAKRGQTCYSVKLNSQFLKSLEQKKSNPTDLLTFSEAVSQAGVPRLQGIPAVEAQKSSLVQAEDGQSKSHAFIPLSRFQAADLLQGDAGSLLAALRFVGLVFKNQEHEAVWRSQEEIDQTHQSLCLNG